nr:AAA domain-containing protein [Bradyrhizobium sp. 33ap4]
MLLEELKRSRGGSAPAPKGEATLIQRLTDSRDKLNAHCGIGPLGVLNGEFAKKRDHLPIRRLLERAAPVIHARETPARSLGVATLSVAQRQAIQNELELLRREHPDTEEFFGRSTSEPFFVKNLENIQGDERDVIFISLGYGRTKEGFISMSFGPLNSDGGERRLNVLISRAKLRCEVFASITGDDIDLPVQKGEGSSPSRCFFPLRRREGWVWRRKAVEMPTRFSKSRSQLPLPIWVTT